MSSPTDPIRSFKRRLQLTWIIAGAGVVSCAVWAFMPLRDQAGDIPSFDLKPTPNIQESDPNTNSSIDHAIFATAKLWNPPPPPPTAPTQSAEQELAQATPPKPLNIQLIGIIDEGPPHYGRKAAIYDIDNDRLLILASGDRIQQQIITMITQEGIELSDGRSSRRLVLKQEPS